MMFSKFSHGLAWGIRIIPFRAADWPNDGKPFTFVTDGVESAIRQARKIAGEKDVVIGAPSVVKQCLKLGLLDEIHIDLVPFLLGDGVRLFDELKGVALQNTRLIEGTGVIHLTYRVIK
jgi:dihydrofolate reductase